MKYPIIEQYWEESERDYGTRPDGYTLHLTEEDRQSYIKEYWARMPEKVPIEYTRPAGFPTIKYVDKKTYEKIKKSKNGIWK